LPKAVLATLGLVASSVGGLAATQASSAQATCSATYSISSRWAGSSDGFDFVVTVTAGDVAINAWTVTWTWAHGQALASSPSPYGAVMTRSGANVTATNVSYDGSLGASASTKFGGAGTWDGTTNPVPALHCSTKSSPSSGPADPETVATATGTTLATITPTTVWAAGRHTGNATWFSAVGGPYGGCGLPGADIDSQNYLALNVQNTPGDYSTYYTRPIAAAHESKIGMFDNGYNCGRWVHVVVGDYCTGTNDGAANRSFCRNGSWVPDRYKGASLDMVVADSCQDGNAWCRDDPYHVDLHRSSLTKFVMTDGRLSTGLPSVWNNRQVTWSFEPAPGYKGNIRIGFLQGSQTYWTAVAISRLPNGMHGVRYYRSGRWTQAKMDSDMGDAYLVDPVVAGGSHYEIMVYDTNNKAIFAGEQYLFSYPSRCGTDCPAAYTPVSYRTVGADDDRATQSTTATAGEL
jgi:hypothetical protein